MKDYSLRNEKSRLIQATAISLHEHITELFENGYDQGYADAKSELGQNAIDLAHEESDRAYQQGYDAGVVDGSKSVENWNEQEKAMMLKDAYQQGLEDAWEAAKKIHAVQIPYEVFGLDKTGNGFTYASPLNWGETITAQEAIAKIKEYEDKQNNHKEIMDFCENMGYSLDELAEVLAEMRGKE